jgi:hypothetical protein
LRNSSSKHCRTGKGTALYSLDLPSCGPYVAERLRRFESDLAEYAKSKAATKRAEARTRAWSTGHDLLYAVRDMIQRMEEEKKETQLFRIDDMIPSSHRFSEHMMLRVNYQWRRTRDDQRRFGTIAFIHNIDTDPDYVSFGFKARCGEAPSALFRQGRGSHGSYGLGRKSRSHGRSNGAAHVSAGLP